MISWSKQWNAVTCGDIKLKVYPNPVSMDSKPTFVKNSILFHVIIQWQSCYDQLVEGLKHYEVSLLVIAF